MIKSIQLISFKKYFLMFCLIKLVANESFAQVSDFKMRNYLYRTPGMRALAFNVNSFSSNQISNKLDFSLAPSTYYFKQYSTDSRQLTMWNNTSLIIRKQSESSTPNIPGVTSTAPVQKDWKFLISNACNWVKRQYKNNQFLEYGSNSSISLSNSNFKNDNRNLYVVGLNPSVGIGMGRLEYVSNAQMALFILDDLKKAGKIKGTVSADKVYQFTELVTELYNTRIFDYRKRRNYETNKIDSFLIANKIITGNDFTVYNIIADNWNYAIQPSAIEASYFYSGTLQVPFAPVSDRINVFGILNQGARFNGKRTTLNLVVPTTINNMISQIGLINGASNGTMNIPGLTGNFDYGSVPLDSTQKNIVTTQLGYIANLRYENNLAIDIHRQQNFSFILTNYNIASKSNVIYKINKADSTIETSNNVTSIGGTYKYCYYPNSRTNINGNASLMYSNSKSKTTGQTFANSYNGLNLNIGIYANYFINYNSRVNASLGYYTTPLSSAGSFRGSGLTFTLSYVNYIF